MFDDIRNYGTKLEYFMWAHQHTTQDNIQRYAEKLFQEISPKLKPQVFLLGLLREPKDEPEYPQHPVCIQPEECGIDVALFNDVDDVANLIWEKDERRNMLHGMPYIHENYHNQVKRDSVRSAVQQLTGKNFEGKKWYHLYLTQYILKTMRFLWCCSLMRMTTTLFMV